MIGAITARWLLADVVAYPGEMSDRRICHGKICVAEVPQVENPPSRWVERLREQGLLRPARVRLMPHVKAATMARYEGDARAILLILATVREDGIEVGELTRRVVGVDNPSGAFERTLTGLYRDGVASPPAGLWATEEGQRLVREGK